MRRPHIRKSEWHSSHHPGNPRPSRGASCFRTIVRCFRAAPCSRRQAATAQQAQPAARLSFFVCRLRRLATDDVPPVQGRPAGPDQAVRRDVRPGHAGEGRRRSGEEECEDDLRSGHQGAHPGHHAVREQDRSHDVDGGQGLGHRGLRRGREAASRRAPDDVPASGRRMGGARDREGRPVRARQIRGQQRRRRLVGKSGPHGHRQPVLEARERHHVEAAAAAGQRDARGRAGGPVVHGGGQSRGVGRSQDRGRAERRAVSEEARRHAGEPHLQIRLQGRSASSFCGAASTTTGRPRCGMPIGRSMRSR